MRAVVQRASSARVVVGSETVGEIGEGLVVFAAVGKEDGEADREWMAEKVANLRLFAGEDSHFARNVREAGGKILAVPQFTLYGDARKGTRPSFSNACPVDAAEAGFEDFVARLREKGLSVETGRFRAAMRVEVSNDGPVTILLDSKKGF